METSEFSALAARVAAGLDDVRACLFVSRDGLTLGAFPPGGEAQARQSWDRLVALGGEPERGFLIVGDELWVVARRGWYTGLAVASTAQSPGLLLDRLDSGLRAIEEARQRDDTAATAAAPPRPESPRRPRTSLHREAPGRRVEKPSAQGEPVGAAEPAERLLGEVRRVVDVTGTAVPEDAGLPTAAALDYALDAPAPAEPEIFPEATVEVDHERELEVEAEPEIDLELAAAEQAAAEKAEAERLAAEKAAAKAEAERLAAEKAAAEQAAAEKAAAEKAAAEKAAAEKAAEQAAAEKAAAEKAEAERLAAEKAAAKAEAERLAAEKAAAEKAAAEKAAAEKAAAEKAAAVKAEAERLAAEREAEAERLAAEKAAAERAATELDIELAEMKRAGEEAGDNHEVDEAGVKDLGASADLKRGHAPDADEESRGSAEEVDPVALAREFARLLQESEQGEDY